mmetsp:Transcript_15166/g.35153  ORF Transcript_15166/g.35153 Transcript_15166/m.35153 type:complete len:138 (+) Transcript_15166:2005-2418(+)
MRVLSPRIDPPDIFEDGSIQTTPNFNSGSLASKVKPKASIMDDFPTPGGPAKPTRSVRVRREVGRIGFLSPLVVLRNLFLLIRSMISDIENAGHSEQMLQYYLLFRLQRSNWHQIDHAAFSINSFTMSRRIPYNNSF